MNHSYKESVIIPYTLFKQCHFDTSENTEQEKILRDTELPSDLKLKLYSQSKALAPPKELEIEKSSDPGDKNYSDTDFIVQLMPTKDQPFVSSILSKIISRRDEISWNDKLEVAIGGKFFPDSNIIELLRFAMKNTVVTNHTDIPPGAREFVGKLYDIGVPKPWVKVSFRKRPAKRATKRKQPDYSSDSDTVTIAGYGAPWITY